MSEDSLTTLSSSTTDGLRRRYEATNASLNENTTIDSRLLMVLKALHDETLSNWTGSFDDPAFDYLNIPLVKV